MMNQISCLRIYHLVNYSIQIQYPVIINIYAIEAYLLNRLKKTTFFCECLWTQAP